MSRGPAPPPLLILGASARSAAQSASRAGLVPSAIDLFADSDLRAVAPFARRVEAQSYPEALERLASSAPDSPWCYIGALENRPDLVDLIARQRPLWGNPGSVLRRVRNPILLAETLDAAGFEVPEVRDRPDGLPLDGSWLVKPMASGGGFRISSLGPETAEPPWPRYYQRRIEGPSLSAVFVGGGGQSSLLGVTRQLVGDDLRPFRYRGSVGPLVLNLAMRERLEALGLVLSRAFDLAGLFGVDFLWGGGRIRPVEVNPRYTASVEVLERAMGRPLFVEHVRAFDPSLADRLPTTCDDTDPTGFVGKSYVTARLAGRFPRVPRLGCVRSRAMPCEADIPDEGRDFRPGEPVLTVFSRGATLEECLRRLALRRRVWEVRLEREVEDSP